MYINEHIKTVGDSSEMLYQNTMVICKILRRRLLLLVTWLYLHFGHIQENGSTYIIVVKNKESKGIEVFLLMLSCEIFDKQISLKFTRKQTKTLRLSMWILII